mmetsp:Transcript_52051/g.117669  ORF Transcript_52051/g.117669 Transcript_52051/m.117669 type:complete len:214 (-) Transcript_52051:215-856(-)
MWAAELRGCRASNGCTRHCSLGRRGHRAAGATGADHMPGSTCCHGDRSGSSCGGAHRGTVRHAHVLWHAAGRCNCDATGARVSTDDSAGSSTGPSSRSNAPSSCRSLPNKHAILWQPAQLLRWLPPHLLGRDRHCLPHYSGSGGRGRNCAGCDHLNHRRCYSRRCCSSHCAPDTRARDYTRGRRQAESYPRLLLLGREPDPGLLVDLDGTVAI